MHSLFIDTHYDIITIILFKDGRVMAKEEKESNMSHSVFTMPLIERIIKDNNLLVEDLEEIIVVNGPGSFTGIRIGVTIAKTMAFALNIPVKTIDALLEKAICIDGDKKTVVISDKNGKFVGHFDSKNKKIKNYEYISNSNFKEKNYIEEINLDYEKIYNFMKNTNKINPHEVNPIYVKNIEVANG